MTVMKANDLVQKSIQIANSPTVYYSVAGGAWCKWNGSSWNMDCVCMIKGILWGFNFNKSAAHGGAIYGSNGVYDDNADGIMQRCTSISTNFNNIKVGEIVHMAGHVGVYIGNRQVVESTAWYGRTIISNIGTDGSRTKDGRSGGYWQNHGTLQYIDYSEQPAPSPTPAPSGKYKVGDKVKINGVYVSSTSTERLAPAVTEGTITRIVNARNPYLLNDGNIGWINDSCIVSAPSENKRYLNLLPSVSSWTVYKSNNSYVPNGNDVAGKLNPQKFGGLTYEILQDMGNYHFKIHTSNFGDVYIAGNPEKYACTITNSPVYPTGSY